MIEFKTYAATSDFHGSLPNPRDIRPVDFLFFAGDACPVRDHSIPRQLAWLDEEFRDWLTQVNQRVGHVAGVFGNHDFVGQVYEGEQMARSLPWTYLKDQTVTLDGIKIHGSPMTPTFMQWAFMADDLALSQYWNLIPEEGLDVLITHGPPHGVLDVVARGGFSVGSETLAWRLEEIEKPQLVVSGHIHESYGSYEDPRGTLYLNASRMDLGYNPVNPIHYGELEVR